MILEAKVRSKFNKYRKNMEEEDGSLDHELFVNAFVLRIRINRVKLKTS